MKRCVLAWIFLCCSLPSAWSQTLESYRFMGDTTLVSASLQYPKQLDIWVPAEYQSDHSLTRYPVILIFDRQNERSFSYILRSIDYLTSTEQMPAAILVGITSTMQHRYGETELEVSNPEAFGSRNATFIFDELVPMLRNDLHASGFTMLIGHSRYGYFTSWLLAQHYAELSAVIAVSPVFAQPRVDVLPELLSLFDQPPDSQVRYFRFGIGNDYPEEYARLQQAIALRESGSDTYRSDFNQNEMHITQLKSGNFDLKGYYYPQAYHNATPGLTVPTALYEIFEYWSAGQNAFMANDVLDPSVIDSLVTRMHTHYGHVMNMAPGILNGKGWFFFNQGAYEAAETVWERTLEVYPGFLDIYLHIMQARYETHRDYDDVLHRLQQALPGSEMYSEQEKEEIRALLRELE